MTFSFAPALPRDYNGTYPVISGENSLNNPHSEYLVAREDDKVQAFEIKHQAHGLPFKQAMIIDNLLLVGYQEHFYLYNLSIEKNIVSIEMAGYFSQFYLHLNLIYVADAEGLWCINYSGNVVWKNENLGLDGVIILKFEDDKIYGSGEWDPPGGWKDFLLDLKTGTEIKQ